MGENNNIRQGLSTETTIIATVTILILTIIAIIIAKPTNALTLTKNEFDSGETTFTTSNNTTRNITLFINTTINHANMTIIGTEKINYEELEGPGNNYSYQTYNEENDAQGTNQGFITNWLESYIENNTKISFGTGSPAITGYFYGILDFNITLNENTTWLLWHYSYSTYNNDAIYTNFDSNGLNVTSYIYNFNTTNWETIHTRQGLTASCAIVEENNTINTSYVQNNVSLLRMRISWNDTSGGSSVSSSYYCDGVSGGVATYLGRKNYFTTDTYDHQPLTNINITINDTTIYNYTGIFNNTININLDDGNLLTNCYANGNICTIGFYAQNYGILNITNLDINYNKTQTAIINITNPEQLTATVDYRDSKTFTITINNNGEYNLTNTQFQTISSSTPNLNGIITSNCTGTTISINQTTNCNITFNPLITEPENDEKIQLYGTGTNLGETVYSNSIDVDITINNPSSGGGGGGTVECNLEIISPTNRIYNPWCPAGKKAKEQNIFLKNNGDEDIYVQNTIEGNITGCQITPKYTRIIAGQNNIITIKNCNCPTTGFEKSIITHQQLGSCKKTLEIGLKQGRWEKTAIYFTTAILITGGIIYAARR